MAARTNIVDLFVGDALATTRRIRADVAHLADLGKRAKALGKSAARETKRKITGALENVADRIIDIEKEFGRRE